MSEVVACSPSLSDVEQKRRKQTLERAKANFLSSQLRLRLQYARLKVEHGWQRQTLSEVENLYFRHSHLTSTGRSSSQQHHNLAPTYVQGYSIATTTIAEAVANSQEDPHPLPTPDQSSMATTSVPHSYPDSSQTNNLTAVPIVVSPTTPQHPSVSQSLHDTTSAVFPIAQTNDAIASKTSPGRNRTPGRVTNSRSRLLHPHTAHLSPSPLSQPPLSRHSTEPTLVPSSPSPSTSIPRSSTLSSIPPNTTLTASSSPTGTTSYSTPNKHPSYSSHRPIQPAPPPPPHLHSHSRSYSHPNLHSHASTNMNVFGTTNSPPLTYDSFWTTHHNSRLAASLRGTGLGLFGATTAATSGGGSGGSLTPTTSNPFGGSGGFVYTNPPSRHGSFTSTGGVGSAPSVPMTVNGVSMDTTAGSSTATKVLGNNGPPKITLLPVTVIGAAQTIEPSRKGGGGEGEDEGGTVTSAGR